MATHWAKWLPFYWFDLWANSCLQTTGLLVEQREADKHKVHYINMHSCIPHEKLQQSCTNMQIFTSTQTSLHAHIEQKTLYNTNSRAHTRLLSFFCPCACASVWTTHISKLPNPSDLFKMPVFHRVLSTGFPRSVDSVKNGVRKSSPNLKSIQTSTPEDEAFVQLFKWDPTSDHCPLSWSS